MILRCGRAPNQANLPGTARGDPVALAGTSNARPCVCITWAKQIDIHGGGNDLVFPHHENEIAQTESYTGKPFARYWMHNGMLQLSGEKMSKSLGNLITIDEFLKEHSADALRLLIFSGHYRKPVAYTAESITGAERALDRIIGGLRPAKGTQSTGETVDLLREATENARASFVESMDDDLNTAGGIAAIFELVRAINSGREAGVGGPFYDAAQTTLRELTGALGLTLEKATSRPVTMWQPNPLSICWSKCVAICAPPNNGHFPTRCATASRRWAW